MKFNLFSKLKKLNALGHSHIIVPLVAVVVIGGIGTYLLGINHADSIYESCTTVSGSTNSKCATWETARVYKNGTTSVIRTIPKESFYVTCQAQSSRVYVNGSYYNNWWAYSTQVGGWVNATYLSGGQNNKAAANSSTLPATSGRNPGSLANTRSCAALHVNATAPAVGSYGTTTSGGTSTPITSGKPICGVHNPPYAFGACNDPSAHNCGAHGQWDYQNKATSACVCINNYTGSACQNPPTTTPPPPASTGVNPKVCEVNQESYLNGICVAGNLSKTFACWLTDPNKNIYNSGQTAGTCSQYVQPGVQGTGPTTYYNGVSGKNVQCQYLYGLGYNGSAVCEKL